MRLRRVVFIGAAGAGVVAALAGQPTQAATGLPANVVTYTPDKTFAENGLQTVDYTTSPSGTPGTTNWRVVTGTGNGAEHWITTTPDGTLLDLGGRYINLTSNAGQTWKSVQPTYPLANAEGAVVYAPNGDILGATWDPYAGDHLVTYKYDATSKAWTFLDDPLHTPFYDRPEVNVIPGPITISGVTYPYISTVSSHGSPYLYSTDGVTYDNVIQDGAAVTEPVPVQATSQNPISTLDWSQGQDWSPLRPLGKGYALDVINYGGGAEDFSPADLTTTINVFDPNDLSMHPLTLPAGAPPLPTNVQVDSRGWMHAASMHSTGFTFQTSTDGGLSWQKLDVPFPTNDRLNSNTGGDVVDMRVNGALGIAAVLTRTDDGTGKPGAAGDPEQDWVYKFDISSGTPKLLRRYAVGLGNSTSDTQYHPTYETQGHRYDFGTVAILPDGHIVASILDESTISGFPTTGIQIVAPSLAFEGDTTIGSEAAVPDAPFLPALAATGIVAASLAVTGRARRRRRRREGVREA